MSLERVARNILMRGVALQWHTNSLLFNRNVSTTTPLSDRGIRGVYRSLNLTDDEARDLTQDDFEELSETNMDDLQANSANIESEAARFQNFVQQKTIGQKYFKDYETKEENLLTWAMKEQLKYLHATDPDEWTPEALAAAFPVSAQGAMRLLKSKWVPENEAAIERHDRGVLARWRKCTNGRLGSVKLLEEALRNRLGSTDKLPVPLMSSDNIMSTLESLQFEHYETPTTPSSPPKRMKKFEKVPKIKSGSFSSIIENYEAQLSINKDYNVNKPVKNKSEHIDASEVTTGPAEYEGTYTQVAFKKSNRHSGRNAGSRKKMKMITLEEFLKSKTDIK